MFQNAEIQDKIKNSSSLNTQAQIIAEWNLNTFNNIKKIGNYRYRPTVSSPTEANWGYPAANFSETDTLNAYTGATDSDIVIDGGSNENNIPQVFLSQDVKKSLLYSLEDCFYRFRPRSGINKILFLNNKKFNIFSKDMFRRPRYYASSPEDKFKYWTSYRTESTQSQDKFYINNIKFVESGSTVTATFTTSVNHNLKAGDDVFVKAGTANSSLKFLPKTYKVLSIPSSTKFSVSESPVVFDELSGDIVGSSGQTITVTGSEIADVLVYITRFSTERGISSTATVGDVTANYISDAAPFIVYENQIPTNRVVVKMQTNVGSVDLGPFRDEASEYADPFFGDANKTVPDNWRVQYLTASNEWVDFQGNDGDLELDETVIGSDGYVELAYGLIVPEEYRETFIYAGTFISENSLPSAAPEGYAYLVQSGTEIGEFNIWVDGEWEQFAPTYGWQVEGTEVNRLTNYVTELVDPLYFVSESQNVYRELQYIKGLRVVVTSMNTNQSTFDLIELSPRLAVDITERTESIDITKGSSDIGNSGLLVSGLVVSSGKLEIFDYDNAFGEYNNESVLSIKNSSNQVQYSVASNNLQVKIFDILYDDDGLGYHIPIKTMYSDGFPDADSQSRSVSINLRDGFFYLESMTAPEFLFSKASLSFVVASLMDSIGFSNYQFKRIEEKDEPIIPYFFVKPNTTVAEILEALALSTQTAIFFDEYNNLTLMSKEYLMPDAADRGVDYTFYGSYDSQQSSDGIVKNERNENELANVIEISSKDEEVYNDGKILYSTRSVIRDMAALNQASLKDSEKAWKYRAALLWEVAPEEKTKPINDDGGNASGYTLSSIPLSTTLSENLPTALVSAVTGATLSSTTREITYASNNSLTVGDIVSVTSFTDNVFNVSNARVKSATATQFVVDSRYKKPMTENLVGSIQSGQTSNAYSIRDNIIDFGESVVYMGRYKGYFYSNGEIIKYDAVEYSISGVGLVWITSATEYKNYFSKMSFAGNIFPTGRVRIYSEPKYENGIIKAGEVSKHGRAQFGTEVVRHEAGLSSYWTSSANKGACKMQSSYLFNLSASIPVTVKTGAAGVVDTKYHPVTTGIIKNNMSRKDISENELAGNRIVDGTIQSSALVMNGPSFEASEDAINYVSYVHKTLDKRYNHFGTRLRIIGKSATSANGSQEPVGAMTYQTTTATTSSAKVSVNGSSAGIAVMHDKSTNIGYYFELVALTENSLVASSTTTNKIYNVLFYKIERGVPDPTDNFPSGVEAFPIPIWAGQTSVNVDDGQFAGQSRVNGEELPSVYDLAVEYVEQPNGSLLFYLSLNNKVIATVTDSAPIPNRPNAMSLFVRGNSKAMFENIYALAVKQNSDSSKAIDSPINSVFNYDKERANDSLFKYSISGMIKDTYLSGITMSGDVKYNLYYEEFGSVMREAAYVDVKYDKAYPALYAKLLPTFSSFQNYVVSGFVAGPYGARFLIFNTTDSILNLNLESGSAYLRIGGVAFTSQSENVLTVDGYFAKYANLAEQDIDSSGGLSAVRKNVDYTSIKNSRVLYGRKEFNLNAMYIQSQDAAEEMMGWMISKMMQPRKLVGLKAFSNPTLQLGDIVSIDYKDSDSNNVVALPSERFVVYHIDYSRNVDGPEMNVYLSEVV
jgi:hypothetical protein